MALGPWGWVTFIGQDPEAAFQGLGSSWDKVLPTASPRLGGHLGGTAVSQASSGQQPAALLSLGEVAGRGWGLVDSWIKCSHAPQRIGGEDR